MVQALLGILTMSALAAVLAFLLELADSYFGDYGECVVNINKGDRELTVSGGNSLLGTLMDEGIFIPSACGGRGSCGLCKVIVHEGGGPLLPTETPYLEPEEKEKNVRLSCQVKVRENLAIEIPPELFLIREYKAVVSGLRDLARDMKEVKLKIVDPENIEFKAGQFIQFQVPEYEGCDDSVYRAYSVASPASDQKNISLIVTKVPEGVATTYIHEFLREGDEVIFNGPYGEFFLRESDRDVYLVATGSGMAPILSILHHIADGKIQRKVVFVFGARHKEDLFYFEEIEELKTRIPDMKFIATLSKPPEDNSWQGPKGRVTNVLEDVVQDGSNVECYICGNPAMVESVEKLMKEKGVPEDLIFYDKFG